MDTQVNPTAGSSPEKILLTIDKSEKDQVLVRETLYKNHEYIDIRIFNKSRDGEYHPTRKGVTLPKEKMKELVRTMAKIKI